MSIQIQTQTQSESELVSLTLVIDKKRKRILYGEADKKFIDFLFTILALPVGTMVKLLSNSSEPDKPMAAAGSLGSLYRSVESLSVNHFAANHNKDSLLNPQLPIPTAQSHIRSLLQIQSPSSSQPNTYYTCSTHSSGTFGSTNNNCRYSFSATSGTKCPRCGLSMTAIANYVYGVGEVMPVVGDYVKGGMVTYIVMDDLSVKPTTCSTMSIISVLKELNVENVDHVDHKLIHFNVQHGVKLLRASLHSSTVLTDLFLSSIDFSQYCSETNTKEKCMEDKVEEKK